MMRSREETISEILRIKGPDHPRKDDLFESNFNSPKTHLTFRTDPLDRANLPQVVIAKDEDTQDFFAVLAAYYQTHVPITAFVHVLGKETSKLVSTNALATNSVVNPKETLFFRRAMLGASIGETVVTSYRSSEVETFGSYEACRKSLSFVLCRSRLLHANHISSDLIIDRWSQLRHFSWLDISPLSNVAIDTIYGLFHTRNQPNHLLRKVSSLVSNDEWSRGALDSDLLDLYPSIKEFIPILAGPYDTRISGLTSIIGAIQSDSRGQQTDEIAIAYFVNSILPGSYRHYGILKRLINFYPSAMVWYGFFASLSDLELQNSMFSTLISKLERDLSEPFSLEQRPKSDVSFEELETLTRVNFDIQTLNSILSETILVSIVPGVEIYVTLGKPKESSTWDKNKLLELEETNNKVARLLEEALISLRKSTPPPRSSSSNQVSSRSAKSTRKK